MKRINLESGRRKKIFKRLTPVLLFALSLVALAVFLTSLTGTDTTFNLNFLGNPLKSTGGRVNVLFLGIPGGTHDGSSLTDTIMVASYDLKTNKVNLISIPRDLWLPALRTKANAVYSAGLSQGSGLGLAKIVSGNVLGFPIHYVLRIDFRGFVEIVDILEGIDVVIERSFDDYLYPITGKENDLCGFEEKEIDFPEEEAKKLNIPPGKRKVFIAPDGKIATDSAQEDKGVEYFSCRYEHISFRKGLTHMDGVTALKFVRSRHGTAGEASDFARSKRQEKVLQAVRSKVLSLETVFNPERVSEILKTLGKSVDTDISIKEAFELFKLVKKLEGTSNFVLDDSRKKDLPEGRNSLLIHPPAGDYGGAYVLVSQDDDFSIVHDYIRKVLSGEVEHEGSSSARTGN